MPSRSPQSAPGWPHGFVPAPAIRTAVPSCAQACSSSAASVAVCGVSLRIVCARVLIARPVPATRAI